MKLRNKSAQPAFDQPIALGFGIGGAVDDRGRVCVPAQMHRHPVFGRLTPRASGQGRFDRAVRIRVGAGMNVCPHRLLIGAILRNLRRRQVIPQRMDTAPVPLGFVQGDAKHLCPAGQRIDPRRVQPGPATVKRGRERGRVRHAASTNVTRSLQNQRDNSSVAQRFGRG